MDKYPGDVNRFWARYRDTVIEYNIPESQADEYIKWAEKFARSIKREQSVILKISSIN